MKQNITLKQWAELEILDYPKFWANNKLFKEICCTCYTFPDINNKSVPRGRYAKLSIGQIIEFLGDDLDSITLMNGHWTLILTDETYFTDKELIDVGWEAAKYKVNK